MWRAPPRALRTATPSPQAPPAAWRVPPSVLAVARVQERQPARGPRDIPERRVAADARAAPGSPSAARPGRLERPGRGMYARVAMSLLGLVALVLLCCPGEAHA